MRIKKKRADLYVEYKERWDNCKTNDERGILREELFSLNLGEQYLEDLWDIITVGVKTTCRNEYTKSSNLVFNKVFNKRAQGAGRPRRVLPMQEITIRLKNGERIKKIMDEYNVCASVLRDNLRVYRRESL